MSALCELFKENLFYFFLNSLCLYDILAGLEITKQPYRTQLQTFTLFINANSKVLEFLER